MFVIQQNCEKRYEYTISTFEAGFSLEASIICTQEPFLGKQSLVHAEFNSYWLSATDNRKNMQVLIAVRKDILNKVIIENQTNLVSHLYCIVLDIKELNQVLRKYSRRTKIVNLYDNKISRRCVWQEFNSIIRRAI